MVFSFWSGPAIAAGGSGCTLPAAPEGKVIYNGDYHVLQYCDGDHWIEVGAYTPLPIETTPAISAGYAHTCDVRADGVAMCWGSASVGVLGNGTTTPNQPAPVTVNGGFTWKTISLGTFHSCGVRTDGVAMCWGSPANGKLGNGTTTPDQTAPVTVNGGYSWKTVSAGMFHTCGVRTDGVAMCWGGAANGKLGNGTTTPDQTAPVTVNGSHSWKTISAGTAFTCGIRTDGVAMCWGAGFAPAPVTVSGGYSWKTVSAGEAHICGIRTDGAAMCWFDAANGKLGNGTTAPYQSAPVTVSGGYSWKTVSAGVAHSCGIRTDGVAMCWGAAVSARLGNGTTTPDQTAPVTVNGGHSWKTISAGNTHSCGIRTDGVAMCWGGAANGRLGNGTTTPDQSAPVLVNAGASPVYVSGGEQSY